MIAASQPDVTSETVPPGSAGLSLEPVRSGIGLAPLRFDRGNYVVGSSSECSHALVAEGVQPQHCAIRIDDRCATLWAFDSRTFLNDAPVRQAELRGGDRLTIGSLEFLVCTQGAVVSSVPTSPDSPESDSAAPLDATAAPDEAGLPHRFSVVDTAARLADLETRLIERSSDLDARERALAGRESELDQRSAALECRESAIAQREKNVADERRQLESETAAVQDSREQGDRDRRTIDEERRKLQRQRESLELERTTLSRRHAELYLSRLGTENPESQGRVETGNVPWNLAQSIRTPARGDETAARNMPAVGTPAAESPAAPPAEPDSPPAPAATDEHSLAAHRPELVAAYMEGLMSRVRRTAEEIAAPRPRAADTSSWPGSRRPAPVVDGTSPVRQTDDTAVRPETHADDHAPRPFPGPKHAQDKHAARADLDSLRKVANTVARSAISHHRTKTTRARIRVCSGLLATSFALATVLLTSGMWGSGGYVKYGWLAAAACAALAIDILQTARPAGLSGWRRVDDPAKRPQEAENADDAKSPETP